MDQSNVNDRSTGSDDRQDHIDDSSDDDYYYTDRDPEEEPEYIYINVRIDTCYSAGWSGGLMGKKARHAFAKQCSY
jgi:hypothetical protein